MILQSIKSVTKTVAAEMSRKMLSKHRQAAAAAEKEAPAAVAGGSRGGQLRGIVKTSEPSVMVLTARWSVLLSSRVNPASN